MAWREHLPPSTKRLPPPASFHPGNTLRGLRRRNRRKAIVMASGAPVTAEYLLLAAETILTNARLFTVSGLLVATDSGPSSTYDVGLDQADLVLANLTDLDAELQAEYIAKTLLTANGDLIYRATGIPSALAIGSTGQVLTVAAGLPTWATPSTPPSTPAVPPHISGLYYGQWSLQAYQSAGTVSANTLLLVPFLAPSARSYDRIRVYQSGAGAANYHLGVYGPFTGTPGSLPLIVDSGQIALSAAGAAEATINITIGPGWYFLAYVSDQARTITRNGSGTSFNSLGDTTPTTSGTANWRMSSALSYGSLPSPSPSAPTIDNPTATPSIWLRAT